MGKLNVKTIQSLVKGDNKKHSDGGGLYLWVRNPYKTTWRFRYSIGDKRREMTLGSYPELSLAAARTQAQAMRDKLVEDEDPIVIRQQKKRITIRTVDDLFDDWYQNDLLNHLKHPEIPFRVYTKEIKPDLGGYRLNSVAPSQIRDILSAIRYSGRPSISNDALLILKRLFNHGIKLGVVNTNPALAFSTKDAGGVERARDRALSIDELKFVFDVFRQHQTSFSRENYLACCLFLSLGIRKSELLGAKWNEFDLENKLWSLPADRTKTSVGIDIPLTQQVIEMLEELRLRARDSQYLFPARRSSKYPHVSPDTVNRAIAKLFGKEPGKSKQPPNRMSHIEPFHVHDLRRTFRSLAASVGIASHIAERCLNHKLKGVEGVYDRYDYLDERREATRRSANCWHQ
ncbi:integrase [Veronia nyctiphanis]|uniref:Integrase n=2 Tax=Veronia nyctiphanis TaxID=1278244 RepID=A0A4Q0YS78_9GAMM|nr:integrase [Veronia nyctiphanis]